MRDYLFLIIHFVTTLAKLLRPGGTKAVMAETLIIKQQLMIMNRSRQKAPKLSPVDRYLFGLFSLFVHPNRFPKVPILIRPSTLSRFHHALVKVKYHWLFSSRRRGKPGPKGPSEEVIRAIVELKQRNPHYGCPRIAQLVSTVFGIDIDKDVVRRILAKNDSPDFNDKGPSWLTFIGHMKDSLWSVDLFRCESILLKSHWVLVVMDQYTRRIIGFGIHAGAVDGPTLCRMFNHAIARRGPPKYLSTDNDPLFTFHRWQANLRILDVEEIKAVPHVPTSHPFVERLIGSIRREYLDQTLFWNAHDLQWKLEAFKDYYNGYRVHAGLKGDTPLGVSGSDVLGRADINNYAWKQHCRGLFQTPMAA